MESLTKYSLETLQKSVPQEVLEKLALIYVYPQYSLESKRMPTVIFYCYFTSTEFFSYIASIYPNVYNCFEIGGNQNPIFKILIKYLPKDSKYIVYQEDDDDELHKQTLLDHNQRFGTDFEMKDLEDNVCFISNINSDIFMPLRRHDFLTDPEVIESLKNLTDEERKYVQIADLYPFEKAFIKQEKDGFHVVKYNFTVQ